MRSGARRPVVKRRATARRYIPSGLVVCGICGRRMAGNYNHGAAHYRCRFPAEYALANRIDHPRTVYVKEAAILPRLDEWLASSFAARNLEATLDTLAAVGAADLAAEARAEAARRKIEDCDSRYSPSTGRHSKRAATPSSSPDGCRRSREIGSAPSATSPAARPQSLWARRSCTWWGPSGTR
jgi:hypothetical protein